MAQGAPAARPRRARAAKHPPRPQAAEDPGAADGAGGRRPAQATPVPGRPPAAGPARPRGDGPLPGRRGAHCPALPRAPPDPAGRVAARTRRDQETTGLLRRPRPALKYGPGRGTRANASRSTTGPSIATAGALGEFRRTSVRSVGPVTRFMASREFSRAAANHARRFLLSPWSGCGRGARLDHSAGERGSLAGRAVGRRDRHVAICRSRRAQGRRRGSSSRRRGRGVVSRGHQPRRPARHA